MSAEQWLGRVISVAHEQWDLDESHCVENSGVKIEVSLCQWIGLAGVVFN